MLKVGNVNGILLNASRIRIKRRLGRMVDTGPSILQSDREEVIKVVGEIEQYARRTGILMKGEILTDDTYNLALKDIGVDTRPFDKRFGDKLRRYIRKNYRSHSDLNKLLTRREMETRDPHLESIIQSATKETGHTRRDVINTFGKAGYVPYRFRHRRKQNT